MTESELRELHPPRRCETPLCDQVLTARISEVALDQSHGFIPAAVFECACGYKRIERLKEPDGAL